MLPGELVVLARDSLAMPILDAIGDEEDESIADRYAALPANAAAGAEDEIPPSFPNILPGGRWIRSSPA